MCFSFFLFLCSGFIPKIGNVVSLTDQTTTLKESLYSSPEGWFSLKSKKQIALFFFLALHPIIGCLTQRLFLFLSFSETKFFRKHFLILASVYPPYSSCFISIWRIYFLKLVYLIFWKTLFYHQKRFYFLAEVKISNCGKDNKQQLFFQEDDKGKIFFFPEKKKMTSTWSTRYRVRGHPRIFS